MEDKSRLTININFRIVNCETMLQTNMLEILVLLSVQKKNFSCLLFIHKHAEGHTPIACFNLINSSLNQLGFC